MLIGGSVMTSRIGVMFMQSQSFFGADSELHAQLLRYMDRTYVSPHVALTLDNNNSVETSAKRQFEKIPDLSVRPTNFGISRSNSLSFSSRVCSMAQTALEITKLAAYIRANNIRIIHGTEKPRDAFYGTLLAKLTGARSVVHMHVSYGDWLAREVKWALHQADAIIAVSPFSAKSIVDANYPSDRVHTVLNALDLDSQHWEVGSAVRETRRDLGVPDDTVVFGVVSRLFLYKGHRDLLEAFASVKEQMPNYRLVIVGEDDPRSHPGGGSFTAELKDLAANLAISENIIFTGFRSDIPKLMESFDVYAMPSWEEPFGMVYLEAMAMRKPVVAWCLAGPKEIIIDDETGYLVTPKAIKDLGNVLLKLARDGGLRKRLGHAGRRRVEQQFSSQRMCCDVLAIYQKLVGSAKDRRG